MYRVLMSAVVLLTTLVAGCGCDDKDLACQTERRAAQPTTYVTPATAVQFARPERRVIVERIDVVADTLAYGGTRGVYVIRDTATGREFIGVSGVGIAETGSHSTGKTPMIDER